MSGEHTVRRRVVVTGAAGYIAGLMLPALRRRYDLILLDVRDEDRERKPVPGVVVADLTDKDRDAYRAHFAGADAVVHAAFVRPPDAGEAAPAGSSLSGIRTSVASQSEARFRAELANVEMAYNVYQTAREEGVRRVVMISSNHAADYYEPLILDGKWDVVTPDLQERAVGYYGWAKATYEHLGFIFAQGGPGEPPLENVQIRIGGPREDDLERIELGDMRRVRRALAVYLSRRDLVQLIVKEHRDRRHPRPPRGAVPGVLRHQRQLARVLEHRQRAARDRLPAAGQQRVCAFTNSLPATWRLPPAANDRRAPIRSWRMATGAERSNGDAEEGRHGVSGAARRFACR